MNVANMHKGFFQKQCKRRNLIKSLYVNKLILQFDLSSVKTLYSHLIVCLIVLLLQRSLRARRILNSSVFKCTKGWPLIYFSMEKCPEMWLQSLNGS